MTFILACGFLSVLTEQFFIQHQKQFIESALYAIGISSDCYWSFAQNYLPNKSKASLELVVPRLAPAASLDLRYECSFNRLRYFSFSLSALESMWLLIVILLHINFKNLLNFCHELLWFTQCRII